MALRDAGFYATLASSVFLAGVVSLPNSPIDASEVLRAVQTHWISNIAHEFASPLQVARGYTRLILEDQQCALSEVQRRYLSSVAESLSKLIQLSRELHEFPAEGVLEFQRFDFALALREAIANACTASGVVVRLHGADESLFQIGDRCQLLSALHVFLTAAVEFTGKDRPLDVELREDTEKIVLTISCERASEEGLRLPLKDSATAYKAWRLHGGRVWTTLDSPQGDLMRCELPIVR